MAGGFRVDAAIVEPPGCPVAWASHDTAEPITQVARSTAGGGSVTEEFVVDDGTQLEDTGLRRVYNCGTRSVYRFDRPSSKPCACSRIEGEGCPVFDLHADDGRLFLSFYVPDQSAFSEVIEAFDDEDAPLRIRRITHADDRTVHDFATFDRNRLTQRQREILETSYAMGYFEHPKRANAGTVADALGIAPSTFSEHLAAAQRKLMASIVDG